MYAFSVHVANVHVSISSVKGLLLGAHRGTDSDNYNACTQSYRPQQLRSPQSLWRAAASEEQNPI